MSTRGPLLKGSPLGVGVPPSSQTVNSTEERHPSMSLSSQDSLSDDTNEAVWPLSLRSLLGPPLSSWPPSQRKGAQVSTAAQVQQARLSPRGQPRAWAWAWAWAGPGCGGAIIFGERAGERKMLASPELPF